MKQILPVPSSVGGGLAVLEVSDDGVGGCVGMLTG
jgi:hypothetical protein